MAIVNIITTSGAVAPEQRGDLAAELARLTYEAEGFIGSKVAPTLCWTFFDDRPDRAFSTGAGDPLGALYYVTVTAMTGAIVGVARQALGRAITDAILAREGAPFTPEHRSRVWVRLEEVADGDLIVGGESGTLADLKQLFAQGG